MTSKPCFPIFAYHLPGIYVYSYFQVFMFVCLLICIYILFMDLVIYICHFFILALVVSLLPTTIGWHGRGSLLPHPHYGGSFVAFCISRRLHTAVSTHADSRCTAAVLPTLLLVDALSSWFLWLFFLRIYSECSPRWDSNSRTDSIINRSSFRGWLLDYRSNRLCLLTINKHV